MSRVGEMNTKKVRKYFEKSMDYVEFRYLPKMEKVWIYFKDTLIVELEGTSKLVEGFAFRSPDMKLIEIQLRTNPNEFTVKVNGKYVPNTKHDPRNYVSSLYFLYMAVFVLGIFSTFFTAAVFRNLFLIGFQVVYMLSLVSAMVGLYIGNKFFFYFGLAFLTFDTFLVLYGTGFTLGGNWLVIIWFLFKCYVIFESFRKIKYVHQYHNYKVSLKKYNYDGDVLDV